MNTNTLNDGKTSAGRRGVEDKKGSGGQTETWSIVFDIRGLGIQVGKLSLEPSTRKGQQMDIITSLNRVSPKKRKLPTARNEQEWNDKPVTMSQVDPDVWNALPSDIQKEISNVWKSGPSSLVAGMEKRKEKMVVECPRTMLVASSPSWSTKVEGLVGYGFLDRAYRVDSEDVLVQSAIRDRLQW
jgi:hypothetical protein